ncbi:Toxin-antitoxin system, toxin component, GNAT family [Neorhizobium galegae bv. officinalis bv. officinalis str. HAMBI 1141]|uniref:Toxin-antitoxin system, toxin component, GNAT family n=1 Tax=Neorhizobium galegae bv. officinalis bv. officinalis str. HAMBI 1141 TaxID=1028801 RepID=A0A068T6P2_NEOGA|nr:GNAT family N-acetyltransferase [Neorhizobium galegae]CDN52985.1 Toxin-antitoxin system, toxin component, GNAT family [Neorhizobium galegae bv. officinalis bv. officinalis str. HAMBI 1141]
MVAAFSSQRCLLCSPQERDLAQLVALRTDPHVRRYLGGPVSTEQSEARATLVISESGSHAVWAVHLKAVAPNCIGLVHIGPHHDEPDPELSYEFSPTVWGKGIAMEALQAVLTHAFDSLGHTRLVSETQAANLASRRLLERLGMKSEKTLERFGAEQVIYAIHRQPAG